jgi:hypothetical protein
MTTNASTSTRRRAPTALHEGPRAVADFDFDTAKVLLEASRPPPHLFEVWAGCEARQGGSVLALWGAVSLATDQILAATRPRAILEAR